LPSLSALNEFKDSFGNVGNEKMDLEARGLSYADLALPGDEPPPFDPKRLPAPGASDDAADGGDAPAADADGFDFSAFLGAINPADEPPPLPDNFDEIIPDAPSQDTQADEPADTSSVDDFLNSMTQPSEEDPLAGLDLSGGADIDKSSIPTDDFFNSLGVDTTADEPAAEEPAEEPPAAETAADDEDIGGIDLGGETLDLGGETRDAPVEAEAPDESVDFGLDGFDLGAGAEPAAEPEPESESFDLGGETPEIPEEPLDAGAEEASSNTVLDDALPDFDFGADAPPAEDLSGLDFSGIPDEPAADDAGAGDELPDFGADFGADAPAGDAGAGDELPDFGADFGTGDTGAGDELPDFGADDAGAGEAPPDFGADFGEEPTAEGTGEMPDLGDLGGEFASETIELGSESSETSGDYVSSGGSDDFALPGLEEIFDKSKIETISKPVEQKKSFFKRKVRAPVHIEEPSADDEDDFKGGESDEIQLTEKQLAKLLATLAEYPLNLRVACEELIAEQVIQPVQLTTLLRLLIKGAPAKETAAFAGEVLGKEIVIPRSFQKSTGEELEAEKASFAYIFVHNFLPILRLFAVVAALAGSVAYLAYTFVYTPLKAEGLYKRGYDRIYAGEYQRANELFHEAFTIHRKKVWFYRYAEGFRDQRRYLLAEAKYEELLRYYPRDKKGVLDYAALQTYYLLNYEKANKILQEQLLDYAPNDPDGLLAAGDNFFAWADSDPSRFYDKYEDARFSYARLLELYGWQPPVVQRMMMYFIRIDDLKEVLHLRVWFENDPKKRKLAPAAIAELGGYLLDKQLEEVKGVPNPYIESIESVRNMLLQAVKEDPNIPELHYHLARYHHSLRNTHEERMTLENAIKAFDYVQTDSVRRRLMRVDTHYRYSNLLINNREFFPAQEQLVRGIELYEDFMTRNLISGSPQLGKLYASKGDIDYFTKNDLVRDNVRSALADYHVAERYGWSPPEVQYRMGAAYYQLENWASALDYLFKASTNMPLNRKMLYALGNTAYRRGDYFAAQGYYDRLLGILENQRTRLPILLPNDRPEFHEVGERLMMARNNAGVVYEALANQTGNREYRSRALYYYAESARAWDAITRDPETMVRMRITDLPGAPSVNPGYLNANNAMRPVSNFIPQIFPRIDKDGLEPSRWEELAPIAGFEQ
jgi:tetratricopeptide (TPR) repeat protein